MVTKTPKKAARKSLAAAPEEETNQKMVKTPAKGKKQPQKQEIVEESSDEEAQEEVEMNDDSDDDQEDDNEGSAESGDDVEMDDASDAENAAAPSEKKSKPVQAKKPNKGVPPKAKKPRFVSQEDDANVGYGHTIFIGHLPSQTTRADIAQLLQDCGKILSIIFTTRDLVFFRNRYAKAQSAYVVLDSAEGVAKALKLSGTKLHNKPIFLNDPEKKDASNHTNTVYVKNLSSETKEESLRNKFSSCGEVSYITVVSYKNIAYVCFVNPESVSEALKLNKTELDGQTIEVFKYAKRAEDSLQDTVYVANMLQTTTKKSLQTFFAPCGEIDRITTKNSEKGNAFAYVSFKDPKSIWEALKLSGSLLDGQKIFVKKYNIIKSNKYPGNTKVITDEFKSRMQAAGAKFLANKKGKFAGKKSGGKFEKSDALRGVKPTAGGVKKAPKKLTPKKK